MVRLFSVMAKAITGELQLRTLRDAWLATHASNIAADILHASPVLHTWSVLEWDWLTDRTIEWENTGRISNRHLYRDTEKLLAECAAQRGLGAEFDEMMKTAYLPESLFYMLCGRPERIILRDDRSAAFRQQSGEFSLLGRQVEEAENIGERE
jgi:hypothetical protein